MFKTILDNVIADIYISRGKPDALPIHGDLSKFSNVTNNGFMGNMSSFGNQPMLKEDSLSSSTSSEPSRPLDPRLDSSKKSVSSVSALKELVGLENLIYLFSFFSLPLLLHWYCSVLLMLNEYWFAISIFTFQCTMEGLSVVFQPRPPPPNSTEKDEVHVQVCVGLNIWTKFGIVYSKIYLFLWLLWWSLKSLLHVKKILRKQK